MMVPHASPQSGVPTGTCDTDHDCLVNQFCAKPAFLCRECLNCTAHHRANVANICSQSILDCGLCMPGVGCEPTKPADKLPQDSQSMYVLLFVLLLAIICASAAFCFFKLLKKKVCAASRTSILPTDAETGRGAPHAGSVPSARSPPPNYDSAVNNNNYLPVQLRPSSPCLDTLDYNSYRLPSADDEEARQMLAERSNSLRVTGLKERDLNQEAVVFRNPSHERPPSYELRDEETEDFASVDEDTRPSEWVASGNDEVEAASVPASAQLQDLLREARGTRLVRPPRYDEGTGDTAEEPPTKQQRTAEDEDPTSINPDESSSSSQLAITDVTTTTQGSNAIALITPRSSPLDLTPAQASGYTHHARQSNNQSQANGSGNPPPPPPPNSLPQPSSRSQEGRESGNLMVNISINQLNEVNYIKI